MSVETAIQDVLATAEGLKTAGAANEANTRALIIEPLLSALGWKLSDFGEVNREYKVFDGTYLDYALQIDGVPKLFVEAKALGKSLADKQFIAQTVNYANNEGVVWCVLTNGLVYQVYKSNEPVPMDRKLLFEIDLKGAATDGDLGQAITALGSIGRAAVAAGQLDVWGETVFTDIRVRSALSKLGGQPSNSLLNAVSGALEGPAIEKPRLRASLERLLGGLSSETPSAPIAGTPPAAPVKTTNGDTAVAASAKKQFTVDHHVAKKPSAIVDLFENVESYAMALGPDVVRRPVKLYIGYFVGKRSFFTVELQKAKIWVYLSLPPSEAQPWSDSEMRDVTNIGHFGMGDTEFKLHSPDQLTRLEALVKQSYLRNRR